MVISASERFAGVEDEFRIATVDGRGVLVDELVAQSDRFFFDEAAHSPVFKSPAQLERPGGRIWTWYGGALYHDYDVQGSLLEATTPLTLLMRGTEALVENIITQRAQVLELCSKYEITGVSTHLNVTLDSKFLGDDLCRYEVPIPSTAFISVPAQKLGADIARIATRTISPVIAYLLFNRSPHKGAIYRPRKNQRMELCLPYIIEPDQMRAGFAFWFAAVDCFTNLIKMDLRRYRSWEDRYREIDYYQKIVQKLPLVVSGIYYQRPSYNLGYQLGSSHEIEIMDKGGGALVDTDKGTVSVLELGRTYIDYFARHVPEFGRSPEFNIILDFLNSRKVPQVDRVSISPRFQLEKVYFEGIAGGSVRSLMAKHHPDEVASVHLRFLESPSRIVNPYSRRLPIRVMRNLGQELEWNHITLEIIEEDEFWVTQYLLKVPLAEIPDYLSVEDYCGSPYVFLSSIQRWVKASQTVPNPRAIFAYGTLMSPEENIQRFGADIVAVKPAHAYGEAYDFGEYPVLIETAETSVVPGMIMVLSNFAETVAKFDTYEGVHEPCPIFFRVIRDVVTEDFRRNSAWIYVGNRNNRFVASKLKKASKLAAKWSKPGFHATRLSSA